MCGLVGRPLGPSGWRSIDQDQIDRFAALTGDDQWIHVDPARARAAGTFGGAVVQGNLILALAEPLADELLDHSAFEVAIHRGWRDVRYEAPVRGGRPSPRVRRGAPAARPRRRLARAGTADQDRGRAAGPAGVLPGRAQMRYYPELSGMSGQYALGVCAPHPAARRTPCRRRCGEGRRGPRHRASTGVWSRRSGVRVPSLTLGDPLRLADGSAHPAPG